MVKRPIAKNEEGQAFTEYLVMLSVVLMAYLLVIKWMNGFGLAQKLASPIQQDFARTYQYGKADVYGFETNGPKDHPRVTSQEGGSRLFISPTTSGGGGGS